ncbi:hypothetical protein LTR48_007929, partial [Friedmanniomyces endolithicus]
FSAIVEAIHHPNKHNGQLLRHTRPASSGRSDRRLLQAARLNPRQSTPAMGGEI